MERGWSEEPRVLVAGEFARCLGFVVGDSARGGVAALRVVAAVDAATNLATEVRAAVSSVVLDRVAVFVAAGAGAAEAANAAEQVALRRMVSAARALTTMQRAKETVYLLVSAFKSLKKRMSLLM